MNTLRVPDPTLEHWADRFVCAHLAEVMTFEQFMHLPPALRERRIAHMEIARLIRRRAERELPDAALHDRRWIDPMHHGKRRFRRRIFDTLRHHFQ